MFGLLFFEGKREFVLCQQEETEDHTHCEDRKHDKPLLTELQNNVIEQVCVHNASCRTPIPIASVSPSADHTIENGKERYSWISKIEEKRLHDCV